MVIVIWLYWVVNFGIGDGVMVCELIVVFECVIGVFFVVVEIDCWLGD